MSFSSYQDSANLFAVFNHAKQCIGKDLCEKPGCIKMKESFPHMENCWNKSCTELSCSVSNRMRAAIWDDFMNSCAAPWNQGKSEGGGS